MRSFIVLALVVSLNSSASDTPIFSFECRGGKTDLIESVEVSADRFINYGPGEDGKIEMNLYDVKAVTQDTDETATGRRDFISNDQKYKPRKYKGHQRFDLSQLTNTKSFGSFTPVDYCVMSLLIPDEAGASLTQFKAPMVINCDQRGGSITLACTLKKIRD
ncbi:MAG: hypothetical protein IT288_00545 [Bdellovibrionales bacterium]|nr:hypothetical protein [Bdellovibrionales bacterium]